MIVEIDVPDYEGKGLKFVWEPNFTIVTEVHNGNYPAIIIKANSPGLISLARHLLLLAQPTVPSGFHFDLDDTNSLEDGSTELIVEKLE